MRVWGDGAVVHVDGPLDVRTAADVRPVLHDALDSGHGDLVLDLSRVETLDATGLGLLMAAHRRAGRRERTLVLRGVRPPVYRVLLVTRLHRILRVGVPRRAPGDGGAGRAVPSAGRAPLPPGDYPSVHSPVKQGLPCAADTGPGP